jgi:cobalt-zinc-cadmium efflux system protein
VTNAFLLFGVAAFILYGAWRRLSEPPEIASGLMLAVALVGLAANAGSMLLLRLPSASLNVRLSRGHGDLVRRRHPRGGRDRADRRSADGRLGPIGLLIIPRTFACSATPSTSCSRQPPGARPRQVRAHILGGVADVHDLHAWTITSGMNVLSAHVVLDDGADPPAVLDELCRCLSGDFDIEHSTFQLRRSTGAGRGGPPMTAVVASRPACSDALCDSSTSPSAGTSSRG